MHQEQHEIHSQQGTVKSRQAPRKRKGTAPGATRAAPVARHSKKRFKRLSREEKQHEELGTAAPRQLRFFFFFFFINA